MGKQSKIRKARNFIELFGSNTDMFILRAELIGIPMATLRDFYVQMSRKYGRVYVCRGRFTGCD